MGLTISGDTLDTIPPPTAPVDFGSQPIENLSDPSNPQDAATKNYVDSSIPAVPTIASTTNLLQGDGAGNAVASIAETDAGDTYIKVNGTVWSTGANGGFYSDSASGFSQYVDVDNQISWDIQNISTGGSAKSVLNILNDASEGIEIIVNGSGHSTAPDKKYILAWGGPFIVGNDTGTASGGGLYLQSVAQIEQTAGRTIPSGASAVLDDIYCTAATTTVTGTTNITTAKGFNKVSLYKPTYTDSSAVTIDRGATLYIEDAPAAAGSVTLTAPYALWVDNGKVRIDGALDLGNTGGTNHVLKQSSAGGTVTSGLVDALATTGVATSPTATQTDTITHGLGKTPTIIRLYGIGTFTSNSSATPTTSCIGVWSSSGNRCIYQGYNTSAITTTQASAVSSVFSIRLDTGANSFITGVVQNVGATTFQIAWTETGTSSAQNYMWEAQ